MDDLRPFDGAGQRNSKRCDDRASAPTEVADKKCGINGVPEPEAAIRASASDYSFAPTSVGTQMTPSIYVTSGVPKTRRLFVYGPTNRGRGCGTA